MQLLGKHYFREDEESGEALGDLIREKRLLGAGADGGGEEIADSAVGRLRAALKGSDGEEWYKRAWRTVKQNKKHFVIAASVLVIGVAVYLNWYLYRLDGGDGINAVQSEAEKQALAEAGAEQAASGSDYFAVSQINRERARDEAMEVLQTVIDGEASEDVISEAKASMSQIATDIENEAQIETLVRSKGFENCVAVISGESASVIVKTDGLLENEIAQIQEIVYETASIKPVNLKIIEK